MMYLYSFIEVDIKLKSGRSETEIIPPNTQRYAENSSFKSHWSGSMISYLLASNVTYYTYVCVYGHGEKYLANVSNSYELRKISGNRR